MGATNHTRAIGIDLGATKIAGVLVSAQGEVLAMRHCATAPERGVDAVLDDIAAQILDLAEVSQESGVPVSGVGVGSPGLCDPVQGVIYNAVNLGWDEVHLVDVLRARLGGRWPVFLQKDANASALGEYYLGAAQGCADFMMFTVGSGLGGGLMAGGQLVTGARWNAAEVGHISLDPSGGRRCTCGQVGCAETVVSGRGLVAVVYDLRARIPVNSPLAYGEVTPALVLDAAGQGDRLALEALDEVGGWLGIVAANSVALVNPARIILGGGLGLAAFDYLLPAVRRELRQRVLPASYEALEIYPSRLESSAMGAACLVWYGFGVKSIRQEVMDQETNIPSR